MSNLKWKAKNETCGVPGKGYIKAADLTQQDIDNLRARAKRRGVDFSSFMIGAGFVPTNPQLQIDETEYVDASLTESEEKPKRKRRTKAEMEADSDQD